MVGTSKGIFYCLKFCNLGNALLCSLRECFDFKNCPSDLVNVLGSVYCHMITISSRSAAQQSGLCSFQVECSDKDLHSGVYGGSVHEAMTDLITLMGKPVSVMTWGFGRPAGGLFSGCHQHLVHSSILSE